MHRPSVRTSVCPERLARLLAATATKDQAAFAELYDLTKRKLVIAAYINGESREELSTRFGAPVNTIKTWLRRAVLDIRAAIEQADGHCANRVA